jgi:hypothetical protein
MPIVFDEITAQVEAPLPVPATASPSTPAAPTVEPRQLALALTLQAERTARLEAD